MRAAAMWVLLFLFAAGAAWAGEPEEPPAPGEGEGEEKPKTEEELRWDKIVEILQGLKATEVEDIAFEDVDEIWANTEKKLLELGPEAVPQLETLLPVLDKREYPVYSEKLREILGKEDNEAVDMIVRVMKQHHWVSKEDRQKLAQLKEELDNKDSEPGDLSSAFAELGWYGMQGLREEFDAAKDEKKKAKILDTMVYVSAQVPLVATPHFLDLLFDDSVDVRRKAMRTLSEIAGVEGDEDFKALDKIFLAERAYTMIVGFLRLDKDTDIRQYAARVLRRMELREASQELFNALGDPKERVQSEAAYALLRIARIEEKDSYDATIRAVKAWWQSNKSKSGKQIKAKKPVRYRKEGK